MKVQAERSLKGLGIEKLEKDPDKWFREKVFKIRQNRKV